MGVGERALMNFLRLLTFTCFLSFFPVTVFSCDELLFLAVFLIVIRMSFVRKGYLAPSFLLMLSHFGLALFFWFGFFLLCSLRWITKL